MLTLAGTIAVEPVPRPSDLPRQPAKSFQDTDGTPGAIRAKYFPDEPERSDRLAWMEPVRPTDASDPSFSVPRFDLSGRVLSADQKRDLPTDRGLHHHGDAADLAGYTVEELMTLCRSTMPGQRAGMMGVLARVLERYGPASPASDEDGDVRAALEKEKVVRRAADIGLNAIMTERSISVLRAGVELLLAAVDGASNDPQGSRSSRIKPFQKTSPALASLPWADLIPRLDELLTTKDYLSAASVAQIIRILELGATSSIATANEVCRLVPNLIQSHVSQAPWPPSPASRGMDPPSVEAIGLLRACVESSRASAEACIATNVNVVEPLLRFVLVATWDQEDGEDANYTRALATETMSVLAALGAYGLAASTAISSHEVWAAMGDRVNKDIRGGTDAADSSDSAGFADAYFSLLETWTVCATDPHKTTPEHDVTWSAISALDWVDPALQYMQTAMSLDVPADTSLAGPLRYLAAWMDGVAVNSVDGAETAREGVQRALDRMAPSLPRCWQLITSALDNQSPVPSQVVSPILRIANHLPLGDLERFTPVDSFNGGLERLNIATSWSNAPASLLHHLLMALRRSGKIDTVQWAQKMFRLMRRYEPPDEQYALDALDAILREDWSTCLPALTNDIASIGHADGLQLLRPLLSYEILPKLETLVGPSSPPAPMYLKVAQTVRSPIAVSHAERTAGLPLPRDWCQSPLSHLLRSADSTALAQSSADWTPSEVEIVRATLALVKIQIAFDPDCMAEQTFRSGLIFALMKVYMLEHETSTGANGAEEEVWRDDAVHGMIGNLTKALTASAPIPASASPVMNSPELHMDLETVAKPFLGEMPFLQFYTDLIALFEATSYGDQTFASVLIPPLAMTYPSDYRRALWVEHSPALRLIRTSATEIPLERPAGDSEPADVLQPWLSPVEQDNDVLSAYSSALSRIVLTERQEALFDIAWSHRRKAVSH